MVDRTVTAVYEILFKGKDGAKDVREAFAGITGAAKQNATALEQQQEKSRRTEQSFNRLKDRLTGLSGAQKRLQRETKLLTDAYNQGLIVNEKGQRSLREYNRLVRIAEKNTRQYEKSQRSAAGSTGLLANSLRGALAGALAGISFREVLTGVRETVMALDNVAKTARNIGISGESLQEFRFALGQLGIDANRGDKALLTLGKRVGELRAGFGALKQPIEAISPDLADALKNARDVEEQFDLLFQAAENLESVGDRQALLAAAFDAETGKVFNSVIEEGIENFRELRQQARDIGIVIDEDLLKQSEELNDQFSIAAQVLDIEVKRALLDLAPIMLELVGFAADFVRQLSGGAARAQSFFSGAQSLNRQQAQAALRAAEAQRNRIENQPEFLRRFGNPFGDGLDQVNREIEELQKRLVELSDTVGNNIDIGTASARLAEERLGTQRKLKEAEEERARKLAQAARETQIENIRAAGPDAFVDRIDRSLERTGNAVRDSIRLQQEVFEQNRRLGEDGFKLSELDQLVEQQFQDAVARGTGEAFASNSRPQGSPGGATQQGGGFFGDDFEANVRSVGAAFEGLEFATADLEDAFQQFDGNILRGIANFSRAGGGLFDALQGIGDEFGGVFGDFLGRLGGILGSIGGIAGAAAQIFSFITTVFGNRTSVIDLDLFTQRQTFGQSSSRDGVNELRDQIFNAVLPSVNRLVELLGAEFAQGFGLNIFTRRNEAGVSIVDPATRQVLTDIFRTDPNDIGGITTAAFRQLFEAGALTGGDSRLVGLAEALAAAETPADQFIATLEDAASAFSRIDDIVGDLDEPVNEWVASLRELQDLYGGLISQTEALGQSTAELEASRRESLDSLGQAVNRELEDRLAQLTNPVAFSFEQLLRGQRQELAAAQELLAEGIAVNINALQQVQSLERVDFLNNLSDDDKLLLGDLLGEIEDFAGRIGFLSDRINQAFDDIGQNQEEYRRELEEQERAFRRVADSLRATREGIELQFFDVNPGEAVQSLRERAALLRDQALGGDLEAGQNLSQVANLLIQRSRETFASGDEFQSDLQFVLDTLREVENFAVGEADRFKTELDALDSINEILEEIRDILSQTDRDNARLRELAGLLPDTFQVREDLRELIELQEAQINQDADLANRLALFEQDFLDRFGGFFAAIPVAQAGSTQALGAQITAATAETQAQNSANTANIRVDAEDSANTSVTIANSLSELLTAVEQGNDQQRLDNRQLRVEVVGLQQSLARRVEA